MSIFDRVRDRVDDITGNDQTPLDDTQVADPIVVGDDADPGDVADAAAQEAEELQEDGESDAGDQTPTAVTSDGDTVETGSADDALETAAGGTEPERGSGRTVSQVSSSSGSDSSSDRDPSNRPDSTPDPDQDSSQDRQQEAEQAERTRDLATGDRTGTDQLRENLGVSQEEAAQGRLEQIAEEHGAEPPENERQREILEQVSRIQEFREEGAPGDGDFTEAEHQVAAQGRLDIERARARDQLDQLQDQRRELREIADQVDDDPDRQEQVFEALAQTESAISEREQFLDEASDQPTAEELEQDVVNRLAAERMSDTGSAANLDLDRSLPDQARDIFQADTMEERFEETGEFGVAVMQRGQAFGERVGDRVDPEAGVFNPEASALPDDVAQGIENFERGVVEGAATGGTQLAGLAIGGVGATGDIAIEARRNPQQTRDRLEEGLSEFPDLVREDLANPSGAGQEVGEEIGETVVGFALFGGAGAAAGAAPTPTLQPTVDAAPDTVSPGSPDLPNTVDMRDMLLDDVPSEPQTAFPRQGATETPEQVQGVRTDRTEPIGMGLERVEPGQGQEYVPEAPAVETEVVGPEGDTAPTRRRGLEPDRDGRAAERPVQPTETPVWVETVAAETGLEPETVPETDSPAGQGGGSPALEGDVLRGEREGGLTPEEQERLEQRPGVEDVQMVFDGDELQSIRETREIAPGTTQTVELGRDQIEEGTVGEPVAANVPSQVIPQPDPEPESAPLSEPEPTPPESELLAAEDPAGPVEEPVIEPEPRSDSAAEPAADLERDTRPRAETEPESDVEPDILPSVEPDVRNEPLGRPMARPEPDMRQQPEPEPEPEPFQNELLVDPEPEPEPEPDPRRGRPRFDLDGDEEDADAFVMAAADADRRQPENAVLPDVTSVMFNIRGERTDSPTGFELRPMDPLDEDDTRRGGV